MVNRFGFVMPRTMWAGSVRVRMSPVLSKIVFVLVCNGGPGSSKNHSRWLGRRKKNRPKSRFFVPSPGHNVNQDHKPFYTMNEKLKEYCRYFCLWLFKSNKMRTDSTLKSWTHKAMRTKPLPTTTTATTTTTTTTTTNHLQIEYVQGVPCAVYYFSGTGTVFTWTSFWSSWRKGVVRQHVGF